ncbi:MAG: hypothetical protein ACXWHZ_12785 [Usitatibacter sp.]
MTIGNVHFDDHPTATRVIVVFSLFVLLFALAAAFPGRGAHQGPIRGVSDDCDSPSCVSTRQIITTDEARQIKRYLGDHALLVDIRATAEAPAGLLLGSDAQVPFMEPAASSTPGNGAKEAPMEFRIDFGTNVDEALFAAHMRHDQPVILMSPPTERAVLAALLLQERGYTRIYVTHD